MYYIILTWPTRDTQHCQQTISLRDEVAFKKHYSYHNTQSPDSCFNVKGQRDECSNRMTLDWLEMLESLEGL